MPLVLAGLLPLVSLAGVVTMRHEDDGPTSIATEPERGAITGSRDDAGLGGGVLDEEPRPDDASSRFGPVLEGAEPEETGEEDDSESPGKTEDSPGQSRSEGRAEGDGQDNADENGRGPDH